MNNVKEIFQILCQIQQFNLGIVNKGEFAQAICKIYTTVGISVELYKMELWLNSNPERHKKKYRRFIYNWLNGCTGNGTYFNRGNKYNDRSSGQSNFKLTKPVE